MDSVHTVESYFQLQFINICNMCSRGIPIFYASDIPLSVTINRPTCRIRETNIISCKVHTVNALSQFPRGSASNNIPRNYSLRT